MPTKTLIFKRKIYYNILKFFGLCSACFVFEACYGVPRNEAEPVIENFKYSGYAISNDLLKPIPNVKVEIKNGNLENLIVYTNSDGYYEKVVSQVSNYRHTITLTDTDGVNNGDFYNTDSSFYLNSNNINNKNIICNIEMKRK